MQTYHVTITETRQMYVEVDAESAVQARKIVERRWKDGEYPLTADHFQEATFTIPGRDRWVRYTFSSGW